MWDKKSFMLQLNVNEMRIKQWLEKPELRIVRVENLADADLCSFINSSQVLLPC